MSHYPFLVCFASSLPASDLWMWNLWRLSMRRSTLSQSWPKQTHSPLVKWRKRKLRQGNCMFHPTNQSVNTPQSVFLLVSSQRALFTLWHQTCFSTVFLFLSLQIREEIEQYGIKIYQFPDCDSDEDEDFKQQDHALKVIRVISFLSFLHLRFCV